MLQIYEGCGGLWGACSKLHLSKEIKGFYIDLDRKVESKNRHRVQIGRLRLAAESTTFLHTASTKSMERNSHCTARTSPSSQSSSSTTNRSSTTSAASTTTYSPTHPSPPLQPSMPPPLPMAHPIPPNHHWRKNKTTPSSASSRKKS